jgi:diguanylate cyclase (GGDEF)-like protein/PAS domain S-box-containing protein
MNFKMSSQSLTQLQALLKRGVWQRRRVWLTSVGVAGSVLALRLLGLLQPIELAALDQLFGLHPTEPFDDRIVIIEINDQDIHQIKAWPIPDRVMADLLQRVRSQQPSAIGLDIYRDIPIEPGHQELQEVFETTPNLIGIEKLTDLYSAGVQPPEKLADQNQIGFNNVVVDADGRVRRALLYWSVDGKNHTSFALSLAGIYLKSQGITPQPAAVNPKYLQLGQGVFRMFQSNDGGYVRSNAGGYQILSNFHRIQSFKTVSVRDVLAGQVDPQMFHNRIVLIGSTASSLRDFFYTPFSRGSSDSAPRMAGVVLHANFIHQILEAALEGRSPIQVWAKPWEWLWIFVWSWIGASLTRKTRSPGQSALIVLFAAGSLVGICLLLFLGGWWLPLVPPLLTLGGSVITVTWYLAHLEEELKKSKEFLNSVINTIPDPVFVKNRNHNWIVLNDAYCRLIGYPLEMLLEKSDYDFFSSTQAIAFWQQDDLTFNTGIEQETEETFTDARGMTYLIATKRSLHKDAAGNLFLVGVIRDITQRKRVEEDLRRTAADLVRSNAELRQAEDQLRQMAYHDGLTGLPNRKLLHDRLVQSVERVQSHGQIMALLFLDLDGFKRINDSHGHMTGDLLLKAVAQRLIGCLRSSDTVARLGGDEFVVMLPAVPTVQDVVRVADKIIHTLAQNFVLQGKTIAVTTSIGISLYPLDSQEIDNLMVKADLAMYQAKKLGKNRYEFFHLKELSSN